jgi:hypothetical protein
MKARGKKSFALRYGNMGFGGLMFIFMMGMHLFSNWPFPRGTNASDYVYILIKLLGWPLAEYSWGISMCRFSEEYSSDRSSQSPMNRM